MPTKLQLQSLIICNHLFDWILWKFPVHFDPKSSRFGYITKKQDILKWLLGELIFVFLGGLLIIVLIFLVIILSPTSIANFTLIKGILLSIHLIVYGFCNTCTVVGYFVRVDICVAQYDILNEERFHMTPCKQSNFLYRKHVCRTIKRVLTI
jgi:NhaP-type Na+/H+ or K+/H+ antiporter